MSEFKFSCPHCDQHILCDEQLSGSEIQCPDCQHRLQIPPVPEQFVAGSEQRPPDSWSPPPLAVQPQTPQNERHNLQAAWRVSPVFLTGLSVVVTGILLLWSMHGLLQSYSREVVAIRNEQIEINARREQLWQEQKKEDARIIEAGMQMDLRIKQDLERNQQLLDQSLKRIDRERQLGKEQAELVSKSRQLPRNSSEYRAAISRLQAIRAELGALAKDQAADDRERQVTHEIYDLEGKLFKLPRRSSEYQATSNQLQALQTQLRKLRGEPAEASPGEIVASKNGMASSSNQLKELDAFAASRAALELEHIQPQLSNPSLLATRSILTLVAGAAFAASVAGLAYALRHRRKPDDYGSGFELANKNAPSLSENLVKLDPDTKLENFLMGGAIGALLFVLGLGNAALVGHGSSAPNLELLPPALWALPFCLAFFIAFCFTDNYYLLDRERHQIFYHFKFLWFRRLRVFLQRKDVVAVTVRVGKHAYRIGVIGVTGRWVALTEQQNEPLEARNQKAAKLAAMLGCEVYAAAPGCELVVRKENGRASIANAPLRFGLERKERWLCLVISLLVLGAFLYVWLSI